MAMKLSIKPYCGRWLVLQEGQPDQVFATKDGAWSYVTGISCGESVEVLLYSEDGTVLGTLILNAAVK